MFKSLHDFRASTPVVPYSANTTLTLFAARNFFNENFFSGFRRKRCQVALKRRFASSSESEPGWLENRSSMSRGRLCKYLTEADSRSICACKKVSEYPII